MSDSAWLQKNMERTRRTQREIAEVLGIDPSGVSRLLADRRGLRESERQLLEDYFQNVIPVGDLTDDAKRLLLIYRIGMLNEEQLSNLSGVPVERLRAVMGGDGPFEAGEAEALGKTLGIRSGWLTGHDQLNNPHMRLVEFRKRNAAKADSGATQVDPMGMIPIYAPARMVDGGLVLDFEVGERQAPPRPLEAVIGAFGLFVGHGDHGRRFHRGDIVYVHPSKPFAVGRDVIVVREGGELLVGEVADIGEGDIDLLVRDGRRKVPFDGSRIQVIVGAWWD